jgi:hypothetical protein
MDHKHRLLLLLPTACAIASLLGGCGGTKPLTRAQLIAKASVICRGTIAKRLQAEKTLVPEPSGAPPLRALAASAPQLAASQSQAVAQLRALDPPASLAHDWQKLLAGLQQLADETARIGADAKAKNVKAIEKAATEAHGSRSRTFEAGYRAGLIVCGNAN